MIKASSVYSDMTFRVLHSLIPSLVGDFEDPEKFQKETAHLLVPGAKNVLSLGAKAVSDEYYLSTNSELKAKVKNLIDAGSVREGLSLAKDGFLARGNFKESSGGKPWADFCEILLKIDDQISKFERTKSQSDAMKLSSLLNVMDGMMHNTGDFLEKLEIQEGGYLGDSTFIDRTDKLLKLRDITELPTEHAINLLQQIIKDLDKYPEVAIFEPLFKDYRKLHSLRGRMSFEESREEAIKLLKEIRQRKLNRGKRDVEPKRPGIKPAPSPPRKSAFNSVFKFANLFVKLLREYP